MNQAILTEIVEAENTPAFCTYALMQYDVCYREELKKLSITHHYTFEERHEMAHEIARSYMRDYIWFGESYHWRGD